MFVYGAVGLYLWRALLFPDQRRSITWFEFLVFFLCLARAVEAYFSSTTSGELFWRATSFLAFPLIHFRVHKIPLWPGRKRSISPVIANTIEGERTGSVHEIETRSGEKLPVPPRSWRFVVLLVTLLSFYPYRFVLQKLELDPVAALENKGASVTGTGAFGSVTSVSGSKLNDDYAIHLQRMTNLQRLSLDGQGIGDYTLVRLQGLSRLKTVFLRSTRVTEAGIAELQRALPDCEISH